MIKKSMLSQMKSIIKYAIDFDSFIKSLLIFTLSRQFIDAEDFMLK